MGNYGKQRFSLGKLGHILMPSKRKNSILWMTDLDMATIGRDCAKAALNVGVMLLCHDFPIVAEKHGLNWRWSSFLMRMVAWGSLNQPVITAHRGAVIRNQMTFP
jgi:hypothetical protein